MYVVTLAAVVLIVVYVPVAPVFRWILKPVSLLELSLQERLTLFDRIDVIVSPDGGAGVTWKVVANGEFE